MYKLYRSYYVAGVPFMKRRHQEDPTNNFNNSNETKLFRNGARKKEEKVQQNKHL